MAKDYSLIQRRLYDLFKKGLDAKEKETFVLLSKKWGNVQSTLEKLINELSVIELPSDNQIYNLAKFKEFLSISNQEIEKYNLEAANIIAKEQLYYGQTGITETQAMINVITQKFGKLPISFVDNIIGLSADGTPLYDLLMKSYPNQVDKLTQALIDGIALGRGPRETARIMAGYMDNNLARALCISRTETMNVLRISSIESMRESGVCSGWERIEQGDACDKCIPENGKIYKLSDNFPATHPNCRGGTIPVV